MVILCTIDLETREVSLPAGQVIASYDHNVDVIRFQAEAIPGFSLNTSSIKIAAQGPNKARHDYSVDPSTVQIEEETGYITFDWPIPAGVTEMPLDVFKYGDKGNLIFAVCAEIIDGSTVSKAWHSDDGIITVVAHLEPESGGGEDPEEEATNAQKIAQLQTNVAVMGTQIGALANGSPTPVSTVAEMTDESAVYLYTGSETGYTAGNWYYYNGSAWTAGGTYGGAVTDTTLSISGSAADAKAVGDALAEKADADDADALDTRVTAVEGDVSDLKEELEALYGQHSENILDVSSLTDGWISSDGTIDTTDHDARVTDFLPVKGTVLTCCIFNEAGFKTETKPIRAVGYYDLNKGFISRDTSNASTFTVPSNATYVRLCFALSYLYEYEMVAWSSAKLDKWVAYREKPESYYSPLYGKSIACFGDSICKGENWVSTPTVYPNSNTGWAKLLKERYNAQVYGYGISGATIRKIQDNTNSVYEQFAQFVYYATSNGYVPDIILFEGGINDATRYHNGTDTDADFGAFVDGYGQSNYYTETIGALERMFYTAKTTFPEAKIIYILPHHCSGEGFQTALQKYIDAIKQACDKWSIPYIDLYTKGRLNGCITGLRAAYFDEYGVHPNQAGYEIMTEDIENGILYV